MKLKQLKSLLELRKAQRIGPQTSVSNRSETTTRAGLDGDIDTFLQHHGAGDIKTSKLMSRDEKITAISVAGSLKSDVVGVPSVTIMDFIRAMNAKLAVCIDTNINDELLPMTSTY